MPIYEYRCENCGHEMDALQKHNAPPLSECPECGQPDLKKLISAPRFRLKGTGWYETDFKSGNKKNLHDSGEKSGGTSSGKKDDKKDAKKDEKTVSKPKNTSGDKKASS